ncbi:MAG: hypothetical protein KC635_04830 [Myxococcales bacterium]|nr:hypothetical protein [Myxococcales bacterium]MCB9732446.1 hypothetical protein [Deltaproteobacteria bacterium]
MATHTHHIVGRHDTDDELTPPPAVKKPAMLVGMAVFGVVLVGIVIFALVSLLGPDRYDRVTVQDLVERPAPAIVVPTTPATPTTVQPTEMEPTTPESTPRP